MKLFNLRIAITLVIGNMIGAGVFTTLGIQLEEVRQPFIILLIWLLGGLNAYCGAIAYGRIARHFPRSGGEFHFISRLYGAPLGFAAGVISLFVGFTAPLALTASAFGHYFQHYIPVATPLSGVVLILIFSFLHLSKPLKGGTFHSGITIVKITLMLLFMLSALFSTNAPENIFSVDIPVTEISYTGIALAFLFTSFAYSGWNASCYVLEEVKEAQVNVGKSLLIGTAIVTILYLGLNLTFLYTTPVDQLVGKIDVAHQVGEAIWGKSGTLLINAMILLALISSTSALILAGSRVFKVMAEDYTFPGRLSKENAEGAPVNAICIQAVLAIVLLLSFTFETILTYTGFTLTIFSLLTVAGNLGLQKKSNAFQLSPLQKVAVWIFIVLNTVLILYIFIARPATAIISLAMIGLCYWIGKKSQKFISKSDLSV